ncbi:translocation/assembly module TamB domain-containing protein [Treponema sp. OMZ 840]|uniref:translocation/assembly module TamB domain-containing protein n=1 Tax=Treponema sp. OMZ 840 TaxID=244313 RepID=UPI003D911559
MKKKTYGRIFSIILLLCIGLVAACSVIPVLSAAHTAFAHIRDTYLTLIREKTGFSVSYTSLSPSILSGIRMSNISVSDIESDDTILTVKSVKLRWNLIKLIGGKPAEAFGELVISGVSGDYDDFTQSALRKRLFDAIENFDADTAKISKVQNPGQNIQNLIDTLFSLPIRIRIKDASFLYAGLSVSNDLHISNLTISRPANDTALQIRLSGKNSIRSTGKSGNAYGTLAWSFSVQSKITQNIQNSFAQLRLSSLRESDYTIPALNMYAAYADNKVQLSLMQNILPFAVTLVADTLEQTALFKLHAHNLNLFDLFRAEKKDSLINKIPFLSISGDYNAVWNWRKRELRYDAEGALRTEFPPKQKAELSFRFEGDEKTVYIDFINAVSSILNADYSGSFDIEGLRPQGNARIHSAVLPNGNQISAELYMESFENESLIFIPQLYFGENSLTALQLRVIGTGLTRDFAFEAYDYSRSDTAGPGTVRLNGSFTLGAQKEMQLQFSTENMFLDSAAAFASWFLPEHVGSGFSRLRPFLSPYICSSDLFLSTDFKGFTYNSPYAVIANTKKDNEVLLFAIDGTESVFQLSRFDMISSGQSVQMQANADIAPQNREMFFSVSLFVNSLPYSFSGIFVPSQFLNITGDYNFNASVYAGKNGSFTGSFSVLSFPLAVHNLLFSSSVSADFSYNAADDWNMDIMQIDIAEVSKTSRISPRIHCAGAVQPGALYLNKARYSDELSSLDGSLNALWNFSGDIFDSLTLNASLSDAFSPERYSLMLQAYNPESVKGGVPDFWEHIYFSAEAEIRSFPSARFIGMQNDNNTVSGTLTALGSLANPSLHLNIENASFVTGKSDIHISGGISLEDKNLVLSACNLKHSYFDVTSVEGSVSLEDFSGNIGGHIAGRISDDMYFSEKTYASPFSFSVRPLQNNEHVPFKEKSFQADLVFSSLAGSFFNTRKNYALKLIRSSGRFDLTAGSNEFEAVLFDDGEINMRSAHGFPVRFNAFGTVKNKELSLLVNNISADAKTFSRLLDLPVFSLYSGTASGRGTISGTLGSPIINAEFQGTDMTVGVPEYVDEKLVCKDFRVKTVDNVFSAVDSRFVGQKTGAKASLTVDLTLEKLLIESLNLRVKTLDDSRAAAKYKMPNGIFTGTAKADVSVQLDKELVDVRGLIETADVEAVIVLNPEETLIQEKPQIDTVLDITLITDTKSRLFMPSKTNPFLRGLVTQTSPLRLQLDTRYGTSSFTGTFSMKGGEILYLNRTFYVREASAVLNESMESFDPKLSAKAEIRERDKSGDPVRIMLTVEDQPLSRLNPGFSSVPVKSQQEIMTLLGQIFLVDAGNTNPLVLLGGLADYGAQITLFRSVENRLRDLFKFDIFSLRTMFLQNAFISALNVNTGTRISAGNFLDNTTVYIGKYFGDTLYADAMLHLVYNGNLENKDGSTGGLVFQPEIGLELPSPFAAIRWSIAPDLTSDWKLLVPHTSISLSWKFNF